MGLFLLGHCLAGWIYTQSGFRAYLTTKPTQKNTEPRSTRKQGPGNLMWGSGSSHTWSYSVHNVPGSKCKCFFLHLSRLTWISICSQNQMTQLHRRAELSAVLDNSHSSLPRHLGKHKMKLDRVTIHRNSKYRKTHTLFKNSEIVSWVVGFPPSWSMKPWQLWFSRCLTGHEGTRSTQNISFITRLSIKKNSWDDQKAPAIKLL